ncbi:phosphotransferase [Salinithrix halophila]|uniref:Phosphotransferase n=1 Tax=Salinithrix halophila TaxID=1485204 RepID=A0ABV8JR00_9BACL
MKLDPSLDGPVLSEVFDRYGWSPRRIHYTRGVLRVQTDEGEFALKKSSVPGEKLRILHQVLESIREKGYPHLLSWVMTRKGEPFAETDQGNWYASPWYGKAAVKGNEVPADELIRDLARFHRLSQPLVEEEEPLFEASLASLPEQWREWKKQMDRWRELVGNREFSSPFDRTFREHGDFLEKSLQFSLQGVERFTVSGGDLPRRALLHKRLHPQNLLVGDEGWRWIDWDNAAVGSPAGDIAAFLRRFLPVEEDEILDPAALLEAYEKEWPLPGNEKKLLALHLAYPVRPLRLLHRYYTERRHDGEAATIRRLEEEVDRLHVFQDWIRSEWKQKPSRKPTEKKPGRETAGVRSGNPSARRRPPGARRQRN